MKIVFFAGILFSGLSCFGQAAMGDRAATQTVKQDRLQPYTIKGKVETPLEIAGPPLRSIIFPGYLRKLPLLKHL